MSSAPTRPAGRYGEPGPVRRRVRLVVLVSVLAVFAVWVGWAGLHQASETVDAQVQSYRVVDGSSVQVTFSLTKAPEETVTCQVAALGSTSARVGFQEFEFGPADGASSVQTVTVRTVQRAVTGVVQGCRAS